MPLPDQDASVMDALGQPKLVNTSLQSSLQEILHFERQYVIEFHAGFVEHTNTHEAANERVALEQALRIFLIEREQLTIAIYVSLW